MLLYVLQENQDIEGISDEKEGDVSLDTSYNSVESLYVPTPPKKLEIVSPSSRFRIKSVSSS